MTDTSDYFEWLRSRPDSDESLPEMQSRHALEQLGALLRGRGIDPADVELADRAARRRESDRATARAERIRGLARQLRDARRRAAAASAAMGAPWGGREDLRDASEAMADVETLRAALLETCMYDVDLFDQVIAEVGR